MSPSPARQCSCPGCRSGQAHPDRRLHQQINLLASRLDERQRRWFVALEATRLGPPVSEELPPG